MISWRSKSLLCYSCSATPFLWFNYKNGCFAWENGRHMSFQNEDLNVTVKKERFGVFKQSKIDLKHRR